MDKKPILILVAGIPASGKTTLSKKISSNFKLPLFSADEIKELISDNICGRENVELFSKVANASFNVFWRLIENNISAGISCIAEALFIIDFSESRIKKLQEKYDCYIIQIYLNCSEEIATKRYDKRHLGEERHSSHIPKMAEVFKKYGGYENLVKISKMPIDDTMQISTNDFAKVETKEIYEKISSYL